MFNENRVFFRDDRSIVPFLPITGSPAINLPDINEKALYGIVVYPEPNSTEVSTRSGISFRDNGFIHTTYSQGGTIHQNFPYGGGIDITVPGGKTSAYCWLKPSFVQLYLSPENGIEDMIYTQAGSSNFTFLLSKPLQPFTTYKACLVYGENVPQTLDTSAISIYKWEFTTGADSSIERTIFPSVSPDFTSAEPTASIVTEQANSQFLLSTSYFYIILIVASALIVAAAVLKAKSKLSIQRTSVIIAFLVLILVGSYASSFHLKQIDWSAFTLEPTSTPDNPYSTTYLPNTNEANITVTYNATTVDHLGAGPETILPQEGMKFLIVNIAVKNNGFYAARFGWNIYLSQSNFNVYERGVKYGYDSSLNNTFNRFVVTWLNQTIYVLSNQLIEDGQSIEGTLVYQISIHATNFSLRYGDEYENDWNNILYYPESIPIT